MAMNRIDNLAGVPLYYDRFSSNSYGLQGKPFKPYIDEDFHQLCESCFKEMQKIFTDSGHKIIEIWSGGVGRSGNGPSFHHKNRAFDLDCLVFDQKPIWVATSFPNRPYIYLAIEACLRMRFGTVLNYDYNAAHKDHLHFDNGTKVKFKKDAKSHVVFLQHTLKKLFDQNIGTFGVDGVWGGETKVALEAALGELGVDNISDKKNWKKYLRKCAHKALEIENSITFTGV